MYVMPKGLIEYIKLNYPIGTEIEIKLSKHVPIGSEGTIIDMKENGETIVRLFNNKVVTLIYGQDVFIYNGSTENPTWLA